MCVRPAPDFEDLNSVTPHDLRLIPLAQAADLVGLQQRKLLELLDHHGIPVIQLSARKRSVLAPHLAELIAANARRVEKA